MIRAARMLGMGIRHQFRFHCMIRGGAVILGRDRVASSALSEAL